MVDLVIRQRVLTEAPDEASAVLRELLGSGTLTAGSGFRHEQLSLVDDGITMTRMASRADLVEVAIEGSADLVVLTVRSGRLEMTCRGTTLMLTTGDLALIPIDEPCRLRWSELSVDMYSFPLSSFMRTLGAGESTITVHAPYLLSRSAELTALWNRLAELVARQVLDRPEVYSRDVVRAQLTDGLTAVTVEAFGLTNQQEVERTRDAEIVARSEAFIRAHIDEPVTVPAIAAAASISVRGLQLAFQRRLGSTPIAHLRRLRLVRAREALSSPSWETTVGMIGRRFGYSNLGRFSAHYRDEFDEAPSTTLERARTGARSAEPPRT